MRPEVDELARQGRAVERALLRRSFADFVPWAWPLIANQPFPSNPITERIIATLQRVADGEIWRVLIACPPGCGKSTLLVCYAAWRRARNPGHRSIHAGHKLEGLAKTESMRVRRLVEHVEFRRRFPDVVLRPDANTQDLWETTQNGLYVALGTDGGNTGKRVLEAVLDDPMDANDVYSQAVKLAVWLFYQNLLSRLDGDRAPVIIVHQRLAVDDLIGRLLETSPDEWTLVILPAELDDNTLMAPNLLSREKLDALKQPGAMGPSRYATQYLQRPASDEGALVKRTWWNFHRPPHVGSETPRPLGCDTKRAAIETPTQFTHIVIAVDMTFGSTSKGADYGVVQAWGAVGAARYLLRQWRAKATQLVQRDAIVAMRCEFPDATVIIERAAGNGGDGAVQLLTAAGLTGVIGVSTGNKSKRQRFDLVSPAIEAGNAYLPLGANWLGDYVEELAGATKHDDSQDATAYALAYLATHTFADEPICDPIGAVVGEAAVSGGGYGIHYPELRNR